MVGQTASVVSPFYFILPVSNSFLADKAFNDTVETRALPSLHGGSLKSTHTVPFERFSNKRNPGH